MMEFLLRLWVWVMTMAGLYVALMVVIVAAACALAGVWVAVDTAWAWGVRRLRRWRLARDLERERAQHRLRSVALTGSRGVPRRTWESGEPPKGGSDAA